MKTRIVDVQKPFKGKCFGRCFSVQAVKEQILEHLLQGYKEMFVHEVMYVLVLLILNLMQLCKVYILKCIWFNIWF